jgi:hypothetical protein
VLLCGFPTLTAALDDLNALGDTSHRATSPEETEAYLVSSASRIPAIR